MNHAFYCRFGSHVVMFAAVSIVAAVLLAPHATAQPPASENQTDDTSLAQQLQELQAKVARLEAALKLGHQAAANVPAQSGGAGGQGMGTTDDDMGEMGAMQPGQGMPGGDSGMMAMKMDKMMGMMEKMMGGMGMMERGMDGMGTMQRGQGMPAGGMGMMGMMKRGMGGMGSMQPGQGMPGTGGMSRDASGVDAGMMPRLDKMMGMMGRMVDMMDRTVGIMDRMTGGTGGGAAAAGGGMMDNDQMEMGGMGGSSMPPGQAAPPMDGDM